MIEEIERKSRRGVARQPTNPFVAVLRTKMRGYTPPRRTSWGTCQDSSADICPFAEVQCSKTDKLRIGTRQDVTLKSRSAGPKAFLGANGGLSRRTQCARGQNSPRGGYSHG